MVRRTALIVERVTRGRVINVAGYRKGIAGKLSNFTPARFEINRVEWPSFENFWQALKFSEHDPRRRQLETCDPIAAKRIGSQVKKQFMYFHNGEKEVILPYGSPQLYALAKDVERVGFEENPDQLEALLATGNAHLMHWVEWQDSKSLPRKVFCRILMELREEFRKKK
jgi:predicted NAD-dependent protein-ADP-ribosyltransferase YbiA (DUF1768 family)